MAKMTTPKRKRGERAKRQKRQFLGFTMTTGQLALAKKHGNPAEFAQAAYGTVPEFCSMYEAAVAIAKYQREWDAA